MLGKLLKYEYKATARLFLPMYIGLLLFSILNKIIYSIDIFSHQFSFISGMSTILYVFMIIGVFVLTFFVTIQRFYKNLLSDEGYLMFTLPVNQSSHIIAKLVTSITWIISSLLITFISILIFAASNTLFADLNTGIGMILNQLNTILNGHTAPIISLGFVFVFFGLITSTLMIYASISIGHLFPKHKIIGSFAGYMGLYMISQIVSSICMVVLFSVIGFDFLSPETLPTFTVATPYTILLFMIVYEIIFSVFYYLITRFILNKKLNLE